MSPPPDEGRLPDCDVSDDGDSTFDLMDDMMDSTSTIRSQDSGNVDSKGDDGTGSTCSTSAGPGIANTDPKQNRAHQRGRPKGSKSKARTKSKKMVQSAPTESFAFVETDDLNPHDVLCGKGPMINGYAGNKHFLAVVELRKADYARAETHKEKHDIATGVCRHVRTEVVPNGRFLKRSTQEQAVGWGFDSNADVWVPVDEATMMNRARQCLREKYIARPHVTQDRERMAAQVAAAAAAQHQQHYRHQEGSSKSDEENNIAALFAMSSFSNDNFATTTESKMQAQPPGLQTNTSPAGLPSSPQPSLDSKAQVPVKEWVNTEMVKAMSLHGGDVQKADRSYQLNAANLALALMETVDLCHRNNMAFGGGVIRSDTILISTPGTRNSGMVNDTPISAACRDQSLYSIEIAGFGSQSQSASANFANEARADLFNVGAVLYEVFSGVPPFQDQAIDSTESSIAVSSKKKKKKKKRGGMRTGAGTKRSCIPLRELGLPVAVDVLVSQMMGQDEGSHYNSAADVLEVIRYMVHDPVSFLFDIDSAGGHAGIHVPDSHKLAIPKDKLYGRDKDISLLGEVFNRSIRLGGAAECVSVAGYSGTGKTSLVLQLRQPLIELGGYFISGKFDTLRQARPLSAIVAALDAYCDDLISRKDGRSFRVVQTSIKEAIGDGADVLRKLIPNLSKIVAEEECDLSRGLSADVAREEVDSNAIHRLMFLMQRFFRAVSSTTPVLLFLDDLQWADSASLELIRTIVCDGNMTSFLFVGAHRSNEVGDDHILLSAFRKISGSGISIHHILLDNMDKISVNALISDTIKLSPLLTRPLTDAVYSKTSGNCLFVVELLADLYRQGHLRYSVPMLRYEWNLDAITGLEINEDVVDIMRRKMLRLGATETWSLKIAACMGAQMKESTLNLLSMGLGLSPDSGLVTLLQQPIAEGLLLKVGSNIRFSHDQIQHAAYSLISNADKPSLHLKIGRSLCVAAKAENADEMIFTCVDQLNRGSTEIKNRSEKLNVARINRHAAKKAIASSTFLAASIYLKLAVSLLEAGDWETDYDLCLEIYSTLAETEYAVGEYGDMIVAINEALLHSRAFEDKFRVYYTLVSASGAQNDLKTAMSTGFEVLEQLGEPFEEKVDLAVVMKDVAYTKGMLESKGKDWFMDHHLMTDKKKLFAMRLLNLIGMYVYMSDAMKTPLVSCRLIQLTIRHGLCKESAYGFSMYGLICSGFLGEYAEAYRVGKIGMAILEKFNSPDVLLARVYAVNYGLVNVWTEPLQSTLPQLLVGHNAGLRAGVPEFACANMHMYLVSAFHSGQPLQELAKDAAGLIKECEQYEQEQMTAIVTPIWQCVLNLIGDALQEDPTRLNGQAMQEDEFLRNQLERENRTAVCCIYYARLVLAYMFGRYNQAADVYNKCLEADLEKNLMAKFENCICTFYGGLTALALQRTDPDPKWSAIVENAISKMETWARSSKWNCEHKLELLKAEKMSNAGDSEGAASAYQKAIKLAHEHGFIQEYGISTERYGVFLSGLGDETASRYQNEQAYAAYMKWGALRKCADIRSFWGD